MLITFVFTFQSHSYHQSKFLNSANYISGSIYELSFNTTSYFDLRAENEILLKENENLRYQLYNKRTPTTSNLDSTASYSIITGQVVKNSFSNQRNYITINKGKADSVAQDMGVITDKGIVGIVEHTSNGFASVQSILNDKSKINAKVKNSNHFGSLVWDAKSYTTVQLRDIPRLAPLSIGDTILTGASSSIFPEDIPIGTISKFNLDSSKSFYFIDVLLFNDMTNIKNVYIIKNLNREEIIQLESETQADDQ